MSRAEGALLVALVGAAWALVRFAWALALRVAFNAAVLALVAMALSPASLATAAIWWMAGQ